jgi:hypothetical protein
MSAVTPASLRRLPVQAAIFEPRLNRHFSVAVRQGQLYQSEWETDRQGKDIFRETERIEWLMGAGANAIGGVVRRGDSLFEAPLTYYVKTGEWALSPGYEEADRGFSRPIEAACIVCHSARPNPVEAVAGRFGNPPFGELAIGCETCHGPGAAHVREMRAGGSKAKSLSIINPGKLPLWLADNICMSCHQNGDARVLQPGKSFEDFRPGQPLDHTLVILMTPPTRESPPDSDHVQHYVSMSLSKCYRSSGQKLACTTCHDPHVEPARQEAGGYFRRKCLACHGTSACGADPRAREETHDNCISCHMPKRDITGISHSSLTNHRIVTARDESFPDVAFQLAMPAVPDLAHIDAIPGEANRVPLPIVLLQAYGQLGVEHREYMQRYFDLAEQLKTSEAGDRNVLEALAAESLQLHTAEGDSAAMEYLSAAIERGSTSAWDFEQVGARLVRAQKLSEAEACLKKGLEKAPYDAKLYALLAGVYLALDRQTEAQATLEHALQLFPQLDFLRDLLASVEAGGRSPGSDSPER